MSAAIILQQQIFHSLLIYKKRINVVKKRKFHIISTIDFSLSFLKIFTLMTSSSQNSPITIIDNSERIENPPRKRGYDQLLRRRRRNRIYRRYSLINTEEILKRLPQQIITNNSLLDQFFNGSQFI